VLAPLDVYGRHTRITLEDRSVGEIVEIVPHA
jgi:hypothetical protein